MRDGDGKNKARICWIFLKRSHQIQRRVLRNILYTTFLLLALAVGGENVIAPGANLVKLYKLSNFLFPNGFLCGIRRSQIPQE